MADNTTLNAGSGGDTFAADDISGVKYPRSKITLGADGTNDGDVSSANPLPIAGQVTVSGSVAVTGTFFQATQPVSGTFWQATQPVSLASLPALPAGTNNIGDVDVLTLPALPTGTNSIGQVTANAGTNLNTSLLALEAGGNLAAAVASLSTIESTTNLAATEATLASIAGCVAGTELQVDIVSGSVSISGSVTVATHAVTQSGTWTVTGSGGTFPVTDSGGSLTVDAPVATPVFVRLSDGSSAISTLPVSLASVPSHAVTNAGTFAVQAVCTNAGTFAVQVDGSALAALQLIDDIVYVDDAAFTAGTSKVAVLGGRGSRARRTAASADGDATAVATDRYGRVQTAGIDLSATSVQVTASGDTALVAAPGAGSRLKILRVEASNSHATVAVTAGLKTAALNSGSVFGKKYLPALGGQAAWVFPGGHLLCGDNEAFNANLSAGSTTIEYTVYYETVLT